MSVGNGGVIRKPGLEGGPIVIRWNTVEILITPVPSVEVLQCNETPRIVAPHVSKVRLAFPVVSLVKLPLTAVDVHLMVGSPVASRAPPGPLPVNSLPVAPSTWFSLALAIAGRAKSAALTTA